MNTQHTTDVVSRASWVTRLLLRTFARRLNREVFSPTLNRLHETGRIDSRVLHEAHRHFDPTQDGVVGRLSR